MRGGVRRRRSRGVRNGRGREEEGPAAAPATLEQRLLAIAKHPPVRRSEAGIVVARVGDPKPVVAVNADRPLVLASTTKLFTTAAALDRLGPAYRFKTRLYRDAEIGIDGVLPGHLVVVGGGDPGLSGRWYDDDPLAVFRPVGAVARRRRGLREIRDGLLLDVVVLRRRAGAPRLAVRAGSAVVPGACLGALVQRQRRPRARVGRPQARARPRSSAFDPLGPPLLSLISQVVTAQRRTCVGVRREAGSHTVVAAGAVGRNRTWTGDVTVPDPPLYFAGALAQVLRENGIVISAPPTVRTERARPRSPRVLLHTHETPILPVLAVCNKRSQSFFAEQILKTLGAETRGKGTWETGRAEVARVPRVPRPRPVAVRARGRLGPLRTRTATTRGRLRGVPPGSRDALEPLRRRSSRRSRSPASPTGRSATVSRRRRRAARSSRRRATSRASSRSAAT